MSKVDHPDHYNKGRYECIDVMQDAFGEAAMMDFCLMNAFKYLWRCRSKNGLEDVRKAVWYLKKYQELAEDEEDRGEEIGCYIKEIPWRNSGKKGHWINIFGDFVKCSECGEIQEDETKEDKPEWLFCPVCGARMDYTERGII